MGGRGRTDFSFVGLPSGSRSSCQTWIGPSVLPTAPSKKAIPSSAGVRPPASWSVALGVELAWGGRLIDEGLLSLADAGVDGVDGLTGAAGGDGRPLGASFLTEDETPLAAFLRNDIEHVRQERKEKGVVKEGERRKDGLK